MDITVSDEIEAEFLELIQSILGDSEFKKLTMYRQHFGTTRLMHSLNVSYLSWLMASRFGWDTSVAARAGLLHDFCLYDFKEKLPKGTFQAFHHPKIAARTSGERFKLHEKERQAILSHMFPLGPLPQSKEAWLISLTDKLCAITEACRLNIALARQNRVVITLA
jgi:uncharacterized protein